MKGAYLVSPSQGFFEAVCDHASKMDGLSVKRAPGVAQLSDSSRRLLTIFEDAGSEWQDVLAESGEGPGPQSGRFESVWIECRFEDLFCRVVEGVALHVREPTWLIDGNSVVWDARRLDRERLQL